MIFIIVALMYVLIWQGKSFFLKTYLAVCGYIPPLNKFESFKNIQLEF